MNEYDAGFALNCHGSTPLLFEVESAGLAGRSALLYVMGLSLRELKPSSLKQRSRNYEMAKGPID
jgi:hypothetical protein